jgi:hypothetical protein
MKCHETGKAGYPTAAAAHTALAAMAKRAHTAPGIVYKCPFCGSFHFSRGARREQPLREMIREGLAE